jgi:hypothetical protein
MHTAWYRGHHKDKAARKKEFLSYRNAFEELAKVLRQEVIKSPVRDYGPGWAEKQIAVNEYNAAIEDVLELIKYKE